VINVGLNWIWLALIIFVLLVDLLTSNFTYSWLALGFIPAFFLGFFLDFEIQVVIALIIGVISLIYGLNFSKKYIKTNIIQEKLLVGKYEGQEFIAEESIDKETRIKINEVFWGVKNIGEKIEKGESFKVLEIKNNKLIIKKGDE
jgi:membrane protein implicated in regulation of membrane protease activity